MHEVPSNEGTHAAQVGAWEDEVARRRMLRFRRHQEEAAMAEPRIPRNGRYRNLKSFQVARLVYDVTVRFCDLYIERNARWAFGKAPG